MKFLFIYGHNRLTGANTHSYTIAKKLHSIGHHVESLIERKEVDNLIFVDKLNEMGHVYYEVYPNCDIYDYIFLFHDSAILHVQTYKNSKKIFIGHSLHEESALPPKESCKLVDHLFYISKFGAEHLSKTLDERFQYMPSWIDSSRFYSTRHINSKINKILILDRNAEKYTHLIEYMCEKRNIQLNVIKEFNLVWDVENHINDADLVIAYGRSAYESMFCDRNVIVFGSNGGDGMMTIDTIDASFQRNCSGWGVRNMKPSIKILKEQLENEICHFEKVLEMIKGDSILFMRDTIDKNKKLLNMQPHDDPSYHEIEEQLNKYDKNNIQCYQSIKKELNIDNLEDFLKLNGIL